MGERTVSNIVKEVSMAIWKNMQPLYLPQPTSHTWESIARGFEENWQFPHCIGAIDGKHVTIQKPLNSGSSYYNYKNHFSIVLMSVVDSQYRFVFIDVGSMGRFSDGHIFSTSVLAKKMRENKLEIPKPTVLPTIGEPMPYVFVGDEAFPLLENLMRPYPKRITTGHYKNKIFNYRLSRARQTVECAFGILASRFRVFRRPFENKVDTVVNIVKAACILHNYLRNKTISGKITDSTFNEESPKDQLIAFKPDNTRPAMRAFLVREKFTDFFNKGGRVAWQAQSISRGKY